jgi:hypothetical protein
MKSFIIILVATSGLSVQAKSNNLAERSDELRAKFEKSRTDISVTRKISPNEFELRHHMRINPHSPLSYVMLIRF